MAGSIGGRVVERVSRISPTPSEVRHDREFRGGVSISVRNCITWLRPRSLCVVAVALVCLLAAPAARAQFLNRQVGGVSIDADGLLSKIRPDELNELKRAQQEAFMAVPGELQDSGLRKVSLRQLEAAIAEHRKGGTPLSDDIRYLAGLQRIRYVFVYPKQRDIVIAGPAEGWKLNALGEVVGVTTNQPVLLLDDLLVALRSIEAFQRTGILCSIDPTDEGLARSARLIKQLSNPGANIDPILRRLETAVGPQTITVKGVPDDSHFGRVLVAADYQMKRIAMGFDPSPIRQLPSYLQMIKTSSRRGAGMLPRWWLEPSYEAILADADHLAFEFRGGSVKTMTEDQVLTATGQRKASGKTDPLAKKWAELMTEHYAELSARDSIFGQLRNCMDIAVLAALIAHENLPEKAGWNMGLLLNPDLLVMSFYAPHQVDSIASGIQKRGAWVLSVSGGVMINPWLPVAKPEPSDQLAPVRAAAAAADGRWWWN